MTLKLCRSPKNHTNNEQEHEDAPAVVDPETLKWSPRLRAFAILQQNGLVLSDKHYRNMELYYECENLAHGLSDINRPVATYRYKWPWFYLGESGAEYFYAVMPYCNVHEVLEFDLVSVDLTLGIVKKYWTITEADFEHARKSLNQDDNIV